MHRNMLLVLILAAVVLQPAGADFTAKNWQYYASVEPANDTTAKYAQVVIPRFIYGASDYGLTDIRIIANGSMEVPYKLLTDESKGTAKGYYPKVFNKAVVPGTYNSFDLDLGKPGLLTNQVDIDTQSTNFMRQVEVDGSHDGINWAVIRKDGYIFDFSRDYHSRSLYVRFPESTYRYYRVKIWNYDQSPIQVTGVVLANQAIQPATEVLFYRGAGTISQNSQEKSTDIVVPLGEKKLPISRIVITSPDANYNRSVDIAGSANQKDWNDFCSGQIMKYDTPKFKGEESSISCQGAGSSYLRIRIHNFDDQPVRISQVRIYGYRQRLFFPYNRSATYRVYYGNPDAKSPVYDIEETFKYVSSEKTSVLKLGPQVKNPEFVVPIATKPWLEKNPWILWVVLVAAVVLLGLLTVRSIIATKQTPPQ